MVGRRQKSIDFFELSRFPIPANFLGGCRACGGDWSNFAAPLLCVRDIQLALQNRFHNVMGVHAHSPQLDSRN